MELVVFQSNLTLKGGAERVVFEIAKHYGARIYTAEYEKEKTFPEFKELEVNIIGKKTGILGNGRAAQGFSYGTAFYNYDLKGDYDVINAHVAPSHWIRNKNERVLWYCHTPLREIYDLYKFRMSMRSPLKRPLYAVGARFVRRMDRKVVHEVEMILANSENTNGRIKKYLGRDDAVVLPGAIDYREFVSGEYGKYFFYPSRFSPNKRQDFAIKAFEIFKKRKKGYKLIIAGDLSQDKFYLEYFDRVRSEAGRVGDVIIKKAITKKEMLELYQGCLAVLYPPINEDYGLVPLEAGAAEKPVIAVNEGGPRITVLDKKTGYLISDENEMAERMLELANDTGLAERMGREGRKNVVQNYSWKHFFEEFDRYLQKVKNWKHE